MADPLWQDFHVDQNRVRVTDENRARLYFAQTSRALDALHRAVEQVTGTTNAESRAVDDFLHRLRRTFDALALRHFYGGDDRVLKIDATDSGFVHWSVLLELAAELEAKAGTLAEIPEPAQLKKSMLEQIVDYGLHPRDLQEKMLRRLYLEALHPERLFRCFLPGELVKVGRADDAASYFWSFATYDRAQNRPFIYLLYFEYDGGRTPLSAASDEFQEIRRVAEHTASGRVNLLAFSNRFDERLPRMRPRIVKRLVVGPYHSPAFTRDGGALDEILDRLSHRLPFALRFEAETLISERETRVGAGWLSKGKLRQVFWIPPTIDLARRGVSQLERFALMPHWLAQHVRAAALLDDHRHVILERDESIRGLD